MLKLAVYTHTHQTILMTIRQKYPPDRPREKLKAKGASSLTDLELLQALIGSGNAQSSVSTISHRLYKLLKSTPPTEVTYEKLDQVSGLGPAKISEILAALELGRRLHCRPDQPILDTPEAVATFLSDLIAKPQEHLVLLTLDGANRLIARHTITIGTLTASLIHPREVFAPAIADRAASIILAHNHPSGDPTPSTADRETTLRLREVALIIGIPLVDHIILTKSTHRSII